MKKKQMNSERKKLVVGTLGIVAVTVLIVANLVFSYTQKQQRISDAQRPLLTQQEVDAAMAKAQGDKSEAFATDYYPTVPQLVPTPKPTPQPPKPTAQPTPTAAPKPTPQPPKPTLTPQPMPTATPTVKPTPTSIPQPPMSESTAAPPPVKPTPAPQPTPNTTTPTHKDGDKRVNGNGEQEIYMSGIGWLPDSPGGTYEPIG